MPARGYRNYVMCARRDGRVSLKVRLSLCQEITWTDSLVAEQAVDSRRGGVTRVSVVAHEDLATASPKDERSAKPGCAPAHDDGVIHIGHSQFSPWRHATIGLATS